MKRAAPPALAEKIFAWYCRHAAVEDLQGDLEELFYLNASRMSLTCAKWSYWKAVLSLVFSYAVKKRKRNAAPHYLSSNTNALAMIGNYFKVASRSLARQKFFTTINVLGMAIGMSFSLLLIALLSFLRQYDTFHAQGDRIYRVTAQIDDHVRNRAYASAPQALGEKMRMEYSGVKEVVRVRSRFAEEASYENREIPLAGYFVDPAFLEVFTFPLVKGNAATALDKPNGMLITETAAKKIFRSEDPIGKIISMGTLGDFEITGVLKDIPKYSHMQFEILAPYSAYLIHQQQVDDASGSAEPNAWHNFRHHYTYFLLPEGGDAEAAGAYLTQIAETIYRDDTQFQASFSLQALNAIAPGKELSNQIGPDWGYTSISIFGILTLLILLPACFNYTNISIARSLKRAKEIGLRKVVGGQSRQIFFQFIVETVIISVISLVIAFALFTLIRGEFVSVLVASSSIDLTPDAVMIFWFIVFALLVGVIAGAVPAIYFSRMNPIQALRSKSPMKGGKSFSFRKVLLVGQFALSLGFIMSVVIVLKQYYTSVHYDFGFTRENILDVELQGVDAQLFKNEFSKLSSVQGVSMSSAIVGTGGATSVWVKEGAADSTEVFSMATDHDYLRMFGLTMVAGKSFSPDMPAKGKFIIVNEVFVQHFALGSPAAGVGQTITLPGIGDAQIIGVVKNFHYASLRDPIGSFFFQYDDRAYQYANLKVTSIDMFTTISDMQATWKTLAGDVPFQAKFFDDEIEEAYSVYFVMVKICGFLGMLAITIACLGLLGMVVYAAETRTKEVGIRKVMGASSVQLAVLLSGSYVKLMMIGAMIATPITYLFFDKALLNTQYYRFDIGVSEVLISVLILLALGLGTVLSQTLRASKANPVDALRYE